MNRRGVTLIEALITIMIGSIAMLAFAVPFSAERIFWNKGKRQTEAQRDAQMAFRAIARRLRESNGYDPVTLLTGPAHGRIDFSETSCGTWRVQGGPALPGAPGQLQILNEACLGSDLILIDGNRSQVTSFAITEVVPNRLVRLHLEVNHHLLQSGADVSRQEHEILETELFLRNGT